MGQVGWPSNSLPPSAGFLEPAPLLVFSPGGLQTEAGCPLVPGSLAHPPTPASPARGAVPLPFPGDLAFACLALGELPTETLLCLDRTVGHS